ncbi:TPA: hypothetical protein ACX6RV_003315 [Photobacterium damselae]
MTKQHKNQSEQQETQKQEELSCFVIMPISSQEGYEPNHFSLVYEDIIKPAIEKANMKAIRADETANTNLIQLDILRKVIESDIAICDMSSKNPNVFFELGVRQAFDKPTVLMIDDVTAAPFDVSSLRYVDYKKDMGYRDVKNAVEKLAQTLRETYSKKDDKAEINSLVRLMELTAPAQLSNSNMTTEDRIMVQMSELTATVQKMANDQQKMTSKRTQEAQRWLDSTFLISELDKELASRTHPLSDIRKQLRNNSGKNDRNDDPSS